MLAVALYDVFRSLWSSSLQYISFIFTGLRVQLGKKLGGATLMYRLELQRLFGLYYATG